MKKFFLLSLWAVVLWGNPLVFLTPQVSIGGGSTLLDDLVAHWKLNEASGTRVDSHGSNDLTDNNTVASATGKIGDAADFEATNTEWLSISSNASLQAGDIDFTFSLWVQLESKGANRFIISKDNTSPAGSREYSILFSNSADRFQAVVFKSTDSAVSVSANSLGSPSLATWYHVIVWHDSAANTLNIQVNTEASEGSIDSISTAGSLQAAGGAEFRLGSPAFGGNFHDGLLDSVWFWKRVLTADERTELWNSGNGKDYPP